MPEERSTTSVFVSYSRRNSQTVDLIADLLSRLDTPGMPAFDIMVDRRDLPYGELWQNELQAMIERADAIVYFVSPESISSQWCAWELEQVQRLSKRLVPVLLADVAPDRLPPAIGSRQLLPLLDHDPRSPAFLQGLADLSRALWTDHAWVKEHTRLSDRARQWQAKARDPSLLLRAAALRDAERWIDEKPAAAPTPSEDILELVLASRRDGQRRQRNLYTGAASVAALATFLATFGFMQWRTAVDNRENALRTDSILKAEQANRFTAGGDAATAVNIALDAVRDERSTDDRQRTRPLVPEAASALTSAWLAFAERSIIPHARSGVSTTLAPDGKHFVVVEREVTRIRSIDGKVVRSIDRKKSSLSAPVFSPDSKLFAVPAQSSGVEILSIEGKLIRRLEPQTPDASFKEPLRSSGGIVRFFPDSQHLLTIGDRLVSAAGELLVQGKEQNPAWDLTPRVWTIDGREIVQLRGHDTRIKAAEISPDGMRILTASGRTAYLWTKSGSLSTRLEGHTDTIEGVAFSPRGGRLITYAADQTARLWTSEGKLVATLPHPNPVSFAQFSADGEHLLTLQSEVAGQWRPAPRIWKSDGTIAAILSGHLDKVTSGRFTPSGRLVLTTSADGTARIWDLTGKVSRETTANRDMIEWGDITDDGTLLTKHGDGTLRIWKSGGNRPPIYVLLDGSWFRGNAFIALIDPKKASRFLTPTRLPPVDFRKATRAGDNLAQLLRTPFGLVIGAVPTPSGNVLVTDTNANTSVRTLRAMKSDGTILPLPPAVGQMTSFASSPSGALFVAWSANLSPVLFDKHGKQVAKIDVPPSPSTAVFSKDAGHIVFTYQKAVPVLWDRSSGATRKIGSNETSQLSLSPRNGNIALVVNDGVQILDSSGKELRWFRPDLSRKAVRVFYAPNGEYLVSSVGSRAIVSREDGTRISELVGHCPPGPSYGGFILGGCSIGDVDFSPDGSNILTATGIFGSDNTARVWTLDGKEIMRLGSPASELDGVIGASFSRDAKSILAFGAELREWPLLEIDQNFVDEVKSKLARCIPMPTLRAMDILSPPRWCITGPGLEMEANSTKWQPKWPYQSPAWRDWQVKADASRRSSSPIPELPQDH
jgi:WD40 repeat protein